MRRIASGFIVVSVLLFLGAPASAQDQFTAVSFDGVAFAFGPELGESVDATRVPGQPTDQQQEVVPADAAHVTFTLYGPGQEGGRTPRVGFTGASVRAYRIADMAGYEAPSRQVDALRALLDDRSALAGFMTVSEDGGQPLPHVPVDTAAAQALRARATFIETADLTGIAYLIGYRQDLVPFTAGDFVYTFQAHQHRRRVVCLRRLLRRSRRVPAADPGSGRSRHRASLGGLPRGERPHAERGSARHVLPAPDGDRRPRRFDRHRAIRRRVRSRSARRDAHA